MSKLTNEARSALQSARAKNRKLAVALGTAAINGAPVPKNIVGKINAIEAYFAGLLDKAVEVTETAELEEAA